MRARVVVAMLFVWMMPAAASGSASGTASASGSALAERDLFGVEFDLGSRLVYSSSFEALSRDPAMAVVHIGGQWLPAGFDRRLAVDARLGRSGSSAPMFRFVDASLDTTLLSAGAAWRQPLLDRLVAVGRLGAGAEYVRVRLDDGVGASLSGGAWSAVVEGTAGLEIVSPLVVAGPKERQVALRLETGYGWRPFGAELGRLERRVDESDPPRIASAPVDLGRLDLSGWVIRGSLAYRF